MFVAKYGGYVLIPDRFLLVSLQGKGRSSVNVKRLEIIKFGTFLSLVVFSAWTIVLCESINILSRIVTLAVMLTVHASSSDIDFLFHSRVL